MLCLRIVIDFDVHEIFQPHAGRKEVHLLLECLLLIGISNQKSQILNFLKTLYSFQPITRIIKVLVSTPNTLYLGLTSDLLDAGCERRWRFCGWQERLWWWHWPLWKTQSRDGEKHTQTCILRCPGSIPTLQKNEVSSVWNKDTQTKYMSECVLISYMEIHIDCLYISLKICKLKFLKHDKTHKEFKWCISCILLQFSCWYHSSRN